MHVRQRRLLFDTEKEVAYLPINCTMRQAMERMEHRVTQQSR